MLLYMVDNSRQGGQGGLSNLCGNLVELWWLWVEVPPGRRPYPPACKPYGLEAGPEAGLDIPQS
jgi:hypothetical protein